MFRFYTMLWPAFVILAGAACLEAAKEPLKIHMISGSKEYKSESSLKKFKAELEKNHRVTITASWVQDKAKNLPGIENVPKADLLIVFARRLKLPEKQMWDIDPCGDEVGERFLPDRDHRDRVRPEHGPGLARDRVAAT
ncbi:MAG: hypothetical protein R3236_08085, partial [Phycisphaeraceae bacterium]|nr:hypothetical protein [Phycisphaeraceae bacterium]